MTKLLLLLTIFFPILSLISCSQFQIADIGPMVKLPASGDCYQVTVVSNKKTRYPPEQCKDIMDRAIFITSEDWKRQRISIQKNCQFAKCKELIGAFDELFLTLDKALEQVPLP